MGKKKLNITWHKGAVTHRDRCAMLNQKGFVVWFTGLSGSGKSTIASCLEKELVAKRMAAYRLDGDNVRHGLNSDLGFSKKDRDENIRRMTEVAWLFKDAGLITLVAAISPYRAMRRRARARIGKKNFIEIFVKADTRTCIRRDPKGLYKKAKRGEIRSFTGISDFYEEPRHPALTLDTTRLSVKECTRRLWLYLKKKNHIH